VEPAARAAGDSHEQEREEQARRAADLEPFERGLLDLLAAEEDADRPDCEHEVQHEAAEVAARLQQK